MPISALLKPFINESSAADSQANERRPHSLRTEHDDRHVGIGVASPRLSWKLPPGQRLQQAAYQIRASSSLQTLDIAPDLFDTGKVNESESCFVPWPGEALASRQSVYWQVRIWLDCDIESTEWSEVKYFTIGLLSSCDWSAEWISAESDGGEVSLAAPHMRRVFDVAQDVVNAHLYVSALGLFEIYLNGHTIHPDDVLLPGWTDFRHRTQVLTFDVSSYLRKGQNVLGVILGDGWYAGHLGPDRQRRIYGGAPAVLSQLEITLSGGRVLTICTDDQWLACTGPILSSDLYDGEVYDARLELGNWSSPEFVPRNWKKTYVRRSLEDVVLDAKVPAPVRRMQEIPAIDVSEPLPGVYIFDLGQNIAGWIRFQLEGRSGQKVTLRFGEMLNSDGTLYTENLRSAKATDIYTFAKDAIVEWEPRFTFHGFRYVELTGLEKMPVKSAITGIVIHNSMRLTGTFRCSDKRVNQLESNIRWGLRGNFIEVPSDCPQRDERLGWSGDIQIFAKTASFLYDINAFLTKWMRDMRDGQTPEGAFPDIAPTFICGHGNAAWADAGVIVPWIMYRRFGDTSILEENYESMARWVEFQKRTSNHLIRPHTAYGDWLAIDAVAPEHAPVPSDLVGTAYFARTSRIMSQIAGILGRYADQSKFAALHQNIVHAFQREFTTPSGRVVGDCQTAYLLSLAFDLLPDSLRSRAVDILVELIRKRDWHLSTGFVGTPLIGPVLSRFGRHDVAMKLLLQETYPSWLYTVKNGATTMWERWNSYTPEDGFGNVGMNSFNHYAYGAIGEWLIEYVGGIAPGGLAPAYRHILFRPQFCDGLQYASTSFETPYGRAEIKWETEADTMAGQLKVPSNAFADFQPQLKKWIVTDETGHLVASADEGGAPRLLSGEYCFHGERIASV